MYPQTNYYYTPNQQQQAQYQQVLPQYQPTIGLKGRPVSSFEEARAISIDFDGSTFFFPDLANKRIYTKQINMDGTASLQVYEIREQPTEPTVNYITREEFDKVIEELRQSVKPVVQPVQQVVQPVPQAVQPTQPISAPAATAKLDNSKIANMF